MKWTQILYQKALARLNNNVDKALDAELQGECSTVSQSLNDSWVTRRSKKRRPVSSSSDDELENKNRTPKEYDLNVMIHVCLNTNRQIQVCLNMNRQTHVRLNMSFVIENLKFLFH